MTNLRPRLLCCFVCFIAYSKRGATGFRTASNSPLIKSSTIDRNVLSRVTHYSGRNPIYNHPVGSNINEVSERDETLKSTKSPSFNTKAFITIVTIVAAAAALSGSRTDFDFPALLEKVVAKIGSLGPYGYIYFAAVYIICELVSIPVIPLAASSGYLFGLIPGFFTVLLSATTAACISFIIGRTLLRGWAQKIANGSDKWRAIDRAIQKEGFKVILLLRITPIFPFSIVNYLYGLTSVNFWPYLSATLLGFTPGTLAIVYAGTAGKAIFSKGFGDFPWYCYLGVAGAAIVFGRAVTRFANDLMKSTELDSPSTTVTSTTSTSSSATSAEKSNSKKKL